MILVIHVLDLRLVVLLRIHEVLHYISRKFTYVLHVSCVLSIAWFNGLNHVYFATILEFISDSFQVASKVLTLFHLFSFKLLCFPQLVQVRLLQS